eukprot:TRINITY_DN3399_c0_g1_i1.p1 TRINITY_DN3399_c0_g1~~TRINITY_DN3399_c0_g1_i1.p1  ORF type:complete len:878 (-),score=212.00 TRINITY_DN3399_c0_g1_i1:92-2725(-)
MGAKSSKQISIADERLLESTPSIVTFAEIEAQELSVEIVGGKAKRLAELTVALQRHSEFPFTVPEGTCLTVTTYLQHLRDCKIDGIEYTSDGLASARKRIVETPVNSALVAKISEFLQSLPADTKFAVRSSSSMEDMQAKSFAGQYDTVLNQHGLENVLNAVRQCWASQLGEHALEYLKRASPDAQSPRMAVVIQVQVDPVISGVLFSTNPNDASSTESIVEAVWGLGEGLVSGDISPQSVTVDWASQQITKRVGGSQKQKFACTAEGIAKVSTTAEEQQTGALSNDEVVLKLAAVGCAIAENYGRPQDIEWCVDSTGAVRVVQARPITAFAYARGTGTWDRMLAVAVSPLGESLCVRAHHRFVNRVLGARYKIPAIYDYYRHFGGIVFTSDNCQRLVWSYYPDRAECTEQIIQLQDYVEKYYAEIDGVFHPICMANDGAALQELTDERLKELLFAAVEEYDMSSSWSWSSVYASQSLQRTVECELAILNDKRSPENAVRLDRLLMGICDRGALDELKDIAARYSDDSDVQTVFRDNAHAPKGLFAALSVAPATQPLVQDLQDYLAKYWWMSDHDEDLAAPHWCEDKTFPLSILSQLILAAAVSQRLAQPAQPVDDGPAPPMTRVRRAESTRALFEGDWAKLIQASGADGDVVDTVTELRAALAGKEHIHVCYVRLSYYIRVLLWEQARRWGPSVLGSYTKTDLMHVPWPVFEEFFRSPTEVAQLQIKIRAYRGLRLQWRNYTPPLRISDRAMASAPEATVISSQLATASTLSGLAVSTGRVIGKARVIRDLAEIHTVRKGEILITEMTSPAWTPIFAVISGLVLEQGGMLSHGAVVARECGLAAVSQVEHATVLIKTGDDLEVDGAAGTVTKLKKA